jgi:chromosome segregation ATPase
LKIQEIVVSAGRTFNHPYEQFSNLRPGVTFKATLEEGEDADKATKNLQAKAESLVEDHKNHLLDSLRKLHQMQQYLEEHVASLEDTIRKAQSDLDHLRKQKQNLLPLDGLTGGPENDEKESP